HDALPIYVERIFVNKLIYYDEYRWAPKIERGDMVVFWYPNDPSKSYIKRVIGLPGDTVQIDNGVVLVNGTQLREDYLPEEYRDHQSYGPRPVPRDQYFVLGDHRTSSNDSR